MILDKKLLVALCVTLLASMGISLPYPVLTPLFIGAAPTPLNQYGGLSGNILLTIIIAVYPLGIFIGSSFIGALSDRFGRKNVLGQTLIICFIGYWVSAYALMEQNYLLLLISRFLTGITEGNVAIARAIALDIGETGDEKSAQSKTAAISFINSAVFLGWLLGPLIGGLLAEVQSYYAMLAAAFGAFVCYILVTVFLQETHVVSFTSKLSVWQAVRRENSFYLLKSLWIRKLFYAYFIYTLAINLFYEFYPIWLVDKQSYGALDIGLATTNMTLFMTLSSVFLVTYFQKRFGLITPMRAAMALLACTLLVVPSSGGIQTHLLFAMCGLLIAIFNGLLPVYVSENEPSSGNGATMGLLTMTFCLANVFASIVGGVLLMFDSTIPIYMSAGFFLFALWLFQYWLFKPQTANIVSM